VIPVTLRAKRAVALLTLEALKTDISRGKGPDEERCLGEGNSDTNSSDAGSSDNSSDFHHRQNYARGGS
jgi:hypothetical protein